MIHTVKGFDIVNKTAVDVFLVLSCFFNDPTMLAIWSLVPLPFLNPAWTWNLMVHELLKLGLENFDHYFTSVWDEYNCAVVWAFFGIAFLWDGNENWPFPVLWPLLSFPGLLSMWLSAKESASLCRRCKRLRLGRCPGGGNGNPLQYSCLENSHGQRSLVGYNPWGCKELDMTEQLSMHWHMEWLQ